MTRVTVVATRAFPFHGHDVHVGEAVDMEPLEAAIRYRRGEVCLDTHARPTYRTRDLIADVPVVAAAVIPPRAPDPEPDAEPEPAVVTPTRRRRRRTRA